MHFKLNLKRRAALLLLAVLCSLTGAWADDELTVYDGTATNDLVPAYIYYFDDYSRSQFVIPATDLTAMNGGDICSIKFYTTNDNVPYTTASTVDVYLKEVDYTTMTGLEAKSSATIVYQGTLSIVGEGSGGSLTITLSTPYTYNGGNLLIGIENTTDTGYKRIYFYGQEVTGASWAGNNSSSLANVTGAQQNFIPKTTFTYSLIKRPTSLATSTITYNSATLTWTENGTATAWVVAYKAEGDADFTEVDATTNPFTTLTGLTPETDYTAKVRAKEGSDVSVWSNAVAFTTPAQFPAPTALAANNITVNSADISWTGSADSYNLRYGVDRSFYYNFETAEAFAVDEFSPCTTYDGDGLETYGIDNYNMPNANYTGSVIAFSDNDFWAAHSGNTMGAFMNAIPDTNGGPTANDDYFILPAITIESGSKFSFWARSVTANYGLERMKVGVYDGNGGFSSYLEGSETTYVEVPVDWTEYSYDLSAYAGQTIQLAINCVSSDAFALFIDDINVSLPTEWSTSIAVSTPYQIEGLTPETNYIVQVQSVYTDGESKWAETQFTTLEDVPTPSTFAVSDVAAKTAVLSWTENGTATEWEICLNDDETSLIAADSNPFTLTGLTPETDYTAKVRAVKGTKKSHWSDAISFTTPEQFPKPTIVTANNITATSADISWTSSSDNTELRYVANANWVFQGYVTNPGAMADGSDASWIQGSQTTFGSSGQYTSGNMLADDFTINSATKLNEIEVYAYQTGSTTTSTFTGLHAQIFNGNPANGGTAIWGDMTTNIMTSTSFTNCYRGSNNETTETSRPIMAITASGLNIELEPGTYWLVYSLEGSGSSGPWGIPYSEPTIGNTGEGLQYSNSAWQSLTDNGSPYGCAMKLIFDEENYSWTSVNNISAKEYSLTNLTPETCYLVQVRSNYGGENNSKWVSTSFTTLTDNPVPSNIVADLAADEATLKWDGTGDSYNVQYRTAGSSELLFFEDFENGLGEWQAISNNTENAAEINTTAAMNGSNGFRFSSYENAGSGNYNQYLISPELSGIGTLEFYYKKFNASNESFSVGYSSTSSDIADFTWGSTITASSSSWEKFQEAIPEGTKYFAINYCSEFKYYLYIDDIGIYGSTTPAGAWQNLAVNDATATLSGLATNNGYEYQIQSVKGIRTSEWSEPQSFALLTLQDNADNTSLIVNNIGRQSHVTLSGRTLKKNGTWHTLCLPFDLTIAGSALADGTAKVLDNANTSFASNKLTIKFDAAPATISAGTPFIVKWANSGDVITNPVFTNVAINSASTTTVGFTGGSFKGNFSPVALPSGPENLYFGSDNNLYWPSAGVTVKSNRAYFNLPGATEAPSITLDYEDDVITGIAGIENVSSRDNENIYDLQGRKVEQPTQKGVYIMNGRKVVIK